MRPIWNEQRLADVTAEAGRVRARCEEVAKRIWDLSPENRDAAPDDAEAKLYAHLAVQHGALSRRVEDLEREADNLETARPVSKPGHLQDSVVARFNSKGLEALSADERIDHKVVLGGPEGRNSTGDGSVPALVRHKNDLDGIRLPPGAQNAEVIVVPLAAIAEPERRFMAAAPGIRPDEAAGGELYTPVHVYPEVGERRLAFGGVERAASMWMSPDGVTTRIPTADDTGSKGEIFGTTAGPTTTQEIAIGNREMKTSVGSSQKMNLSIWMDGDTPVDMDGMYRKNAWRRLGRAWSDQWLNGDGSDDKPRGMLTDAQLGKQFVGEFGPTTDELIDLQDSIDVGYLDGENDYYGMGPPGGGMGWWVWHQSELREIRKLRGSDGHFIWLPSLVSGDPGTVLSWPYIIDNDMPAPPAAADGATQKVILAGNLMQYLIRKAPMAFLARFWDSNTANTMSYQYVAFNRCWGRFMGGFPVLTADAVECVKYGQTVA